MDELAQDGDPQEPAPVRKKDRRKRIRVKLSGVEKDMREVLKTEVGPEDESPQRKLLRQLKREDPGRFMDRLVKLESARRVKFKPVEHPEAVAGPAAEVVEADPGHEAAYALVQRMLKEFREQREGKR